MIRELEHCQSLNASSTTSDWSEPLSERVVKVARVQLLGASDARRCVAAAINRAKYPPPILYPSYTLTSPFNTQRVINTVKPKLLSVFKVAPRQTISAAVLPKVRTPLACIIRRLWAHGTAQRFSNFTTYDLPQKQPTEHSTNSHVEG